MSVKAIRPLSVLTPPEPNGLHTDLFGRTAMQKEVRTICYDEKLKIEAYRFENITQPFPNHFHEHYVIGYIESGSRSLICRNREYHSSSGDIIIFNPGDSHSCEQTDERPLNYMGLNISKETMEELAEEVTDQAELPVFSENVIKDEKLACYLIPLHKMIMDGSTEFEKEEYLFLMISLLIEGYSRPTDTAPPECIGEIETACEFMRQNYSEHISLEQICRHCGLSKSTLLRCFTKSKGVTPYRYLQTVRINEAKNLLEKGVMPIEAAARTGFSDQSHFTAFFNMFIGLTPGAYREIFLQ